MKIKVKNCEIDYWQKGKGDKLLFLHGWAKDISKEKYVNLFVGEEGLTAGVVNKK